MEERAELKGAHACVHPHSTATLLEISTDPCHSLMEKNCLSVGAAGPRTKTPSTC